MNAWRNTIEQYSIKFLAPSIDYDLSKPPGLRNRGGGTGVKYARINESSDLHLCKSVSSIDEIEADDIVFADWLWFYNEQDKIDSVKSFLELPNVKGIFSSFVHWFIFHVSRVLHFLFTRTVCNLS